MTFWLYPSHHAITRPELSNWPRTDIMACHHVARSDPELTWHRAAIGGKWSLPAWVRSIMARVEASFAEGASASSS